MCLGVQVASHSFLLCEARTVVIVWSSRHISALGKLESTASASQERTINSEGEKLNEAEENTLLLKQHHYFARRGGPVQGLCPIQDCLFGRFWDRNN